MAEELATLAGEVLAEKENVKDTLGGISTAEATKQAPVAGKAITEKANVLETLAGNTIVEKRTESTLASKTTAEKPTADTLAGNATAEMVNIKSTVAGKMSAEKVMESTIAGKAGLEADVVSPVAGKATAEKRTQATVAAKSTLENAVGGTNKTIAGIAEGQAYDFNFPEQTTLANTVAKNVTVIMRNASINRSNNNAQLQAVRTLIATIDPDATSGTTYAPQVVIDVIKSIYGI